MTYNITISRKKHNHFKNNVKYSVDTYGWNMYYVFVLQARSFNTRKKANL